MGAPVEDKVPYILRSHQPGDLGWIVHRHGVLYSLVKLEASGLMDELIEKHDKTGGNAGRRYGNQRYAPAGGRR